MQTLALSHGYRETVFKDPRLKCNKSRYEADIGENIASSTVTI